MVSALCAIVVGGISVNLRADERRYCSPIEQPLTVEFVATNSPTPGGTLNFALRVTPARDIDHLHIVLSTEGILALSSPLDETIDNAANGVLIQRTGSASITGPGGGSIFATISDSTTTACATLPGTSHVYLLSVLDDGEAVRVDNLTVTELAIARIEERVAGGDITPEQAAVLLEILAEDEIDLDPEPLAPSDRGTPMGDATISGRIQWNDQQGNPHPARGITVKAFVTTLPITTAMTDNNGNYSLTISEFDLDDTPTDIRVRAYADNRAAFVTTPTAVNDVLPYTYNVLANVADVVKGSSRTADMTIDTSNDVRRAFGIVDATLVGQDYVTGINGSTMSQIRVRSPVGGASNYNGTLLSINFTSWETWDVILHEYGHYIQGTFNLANNPGGMHNIGQDLIATHGLDAGTRLGWGEGHATYLMYAEQQAAIAAGTMPAVQWTGGGASNDKSYHDVGWGYDMELNQAGFTFVGEQDEVNTTRIMIDFADSTNDGKEKMALGDSFLWNKVKALHPQRLADVWNSLTSGLSVQQKLTYATAMLQNAVGAKDLVPADNAGITVSDPAPTFSWTKRKLDDFRLVFFDSMDGQVFDTGALGDVSDYTPSASDWATIGAADSWIVEGRNNDGTIQTGWYLSERNHLRGVDFAFVIDDTGSMSEELGGVLSGLQAFLSTFDPSSHDVTFQLTTFKDSPFVRAPTSDVATIQSQVAALFASGGGDCPEDSVGGLLSGSQLLKRGGTLFFATDANARSGDDGSVLTSLRDKGARVNIMQTGTCDSEGEGFAALSARSLGASDNHDSAASSAPPEPRASSDFANSIDFYSQLAAATGGSYAFIPEANSGLASVGYQYFVHTVENVLFASIEPRIVSAAPYTVPQNSTVIVDFVGQGTSFLDTTTLTLANAGITVVSVERISPVGLRVTMQVASDAPIGFTDVTAHTQLSADISQDALGQGVLYVSANPGSPKLLSASPPVVNLGETLNVTLHATGTSFATGTSAASFSNGVTVNSLTISDPTTAVANITISPEASPGYRFVTVTTNSETAYSTSNSFFRVADVVDVPAITNITPPTVQRRQEVNITITFAHLDLQGSPDLTIVGGGIDVSNVAGCGDLLTAHLSVASNAPFGARDVIVHSGDSTVVQPDGITVAGVEMTDDPVVRTIDPVGGPASGGYPAVISGEKFASDALVKWNGADVAAVVNNDGTQITVTVPAGTAGRAVAVDVVNPGAMHSGRVVFFYDAASGVPGDSGTSGDQGPAGDSGLTGPAGQNGSGGPPAGDTTPTDTVVFHEFTTQVCGAGLCGATNGLVPVMMLLSLMTTKRIRKRRR